MTPATATAPSAPWAVPTAVAGDVRLVRDAVRHARLDAASGDVAVLAVDGLTHALAARLWDVDVTALTTTFPTTSAAGWMSSTTGLSVADHGWPGAWVRPDVGRDPVDVFTATDAWPLAPPAAPNLFSDAIAGGWAAAVLLHELHASASRFVADLCRDAVRVPSAPLFGAAGAPAHADPAAVVAGMLDGVRRARAHATAAHGARRRLLTWSFVELDRYVHVAGYDTRAEATVAALGEAARTLAASGVTVVAYSDHGLVPTTRAPDLERAVDELLVAHGARVGGAGRVRWFHAAGPDAVPALRDAVAEAFDGHGRLVDAARIAPAGSLAGDALGDVVVEATSVEFLAPEGYVFDHGGSSAAESVVPLAVWPARA